MKKLYLGIDLGGTNVRVAKVSETGEILEMIKAPSYALQSQDIILDNLFAQIDKIGDLSEVVGIGIGVPGPVDQVNGWMNMASNIPAMLKVPLVQLLSQRYNKPVVMDNDANCTGLAEALVGAGKGYNPVVYLTHSTGIGAGIVVNGQTLSGAHGFGGEVANIIIDPAREKMSHLNGGAVEAEASGTAIVAKAKAQIDPQINSGVEVFNLYQENHPAAQAIIDQMTTDFAVMMSSITAIVDPAIYVIGGGVSLSANLYFEQLKEKYRARVHKFIQDVPIVLAQLEEPGIIGAAMLPKSKGI